mmetsp:Transcript_26315/g.84200  ORF Transcript_26315/g.84200 Transcript_26315/m.84200 type:complete len:160 (-) Transcript_26315:20-499(-)
MAGPVHLSTPVRGCSVAGVLSARALAFGAVLGGRPDAPAVPPLQAEPIDWGYWKKELGDEALVSSFETAFNNIKIPEYDGKEMEAAKAIFAKLEQEATQESADAEVALKELRAELEMVQSQMAELDTMTVEDVFKKDPAMAKEIDDEIRAGDWFDSSRA